ncbi:nicotinate-nucleotide pyrophosphorylase [carboxylating], chloroplastic isoform X1, partial [Olea europaea subsp. europaea]
MYIACGWEEDVTCKATITAEMEVEAHFLAKEDGIVAGIALAEMVFGEVDLPEGRADGIDVAERVVLSFMQRMSGIATLTK